MIIQQELLPTLPYQTQKLTIRHLSFVSLTPISSLIQTHRFVVFSFIVFGILSRQNFIFLSSLTVLLLFLWTVFH